jgi:hypothetical protein
MKLGTVVSPIIATLLTQIFTLFFWNASSADAFLSTGSIRKPGPFPPAKALGNGWSPVTRIVSFEKKTDGQDGKVQVGTKEYLEGFISSPIQDGTVQERGTGLEQALKLGGSVTIGLVLLFFGFMACNGLL